MHPIYAPGNTTHGDACVFFHAVTHNTLVYCISQSKQTVDCFHLVIVKDYIQI